MTQHARSGAAHLPPMRATVVIVLAAMFAAACSSPRDRPRPRPGDAVATPGTGGGDAAPDGTAPDDRAAEVSADSGSGTDLLSPGDRGTPPDAGPPDTGGNGGGEALLVVGQIPLIGSDVQLHEQLASRGLAVQDLLDSMTTPGSAAGKKVVVLSYSVDSEEVRGKFNDAAVPIIVTEHNLLDSLGMTAPGGGHGWQLGVTQVTVTAPDHPLAAGFSGDVTVYTKSGEVFWGIPSPAAIKVASVKGNPGRPVTFVYAAGAMMVGGKVAPAKRVQFFLGAHLTPDRWLNPAGLKMLDAAIDWCVQ